MSLFREKFMRKALSLHPVALSCVLLLGGCAAAPSDKNTKAASGSTQTASQSPDTATEVGRAITSPLSDLNLVKADIPPLLASARQAPYALPADRSCPALAEQVQALDAVLGADLDTPSTDANPSLIERGAGAAKKGAIGAVRGAAEGVVPMRSWVRKLTGAEKYSREVEASITAGTIRRSYLKGLGQAAGCEAPAAPRQQVAE